MFCGRNCLMFINVFLIHTWDALFLFWFYMCLSFKLKNLNSSWQEISFLLAFLVIQIYHVSEIYNNKLTIWLLKKILFIKHHQVAFIQVLIWCQALNPETSRGGRCDYYPHLLMRKLRCKIHRSVSDEASIWTPKSLTPSLSLALGFIFPPCLWN